MADLLVADVTHRLNQIVNFVNTQLVNEDSNKVFLKNPTKGLVEAGLIRPQSDSTIAGSNRLLYTSLANPELQAYIRKNVPSAPIAVFGEELANEVGGWPAFEKLIEYAGNNYLYNKNALRDMLGIVINDANQKGILPVQLPNNDNTTTLTSACQIGDTSGSIVTVPPSWITGEGLWLLVDRGRSINSNAVFSGLTGTSFRLGANAGGHGQGWWNAFGMAYRQGSTVEVVTKLTTACPPGTTVFPLGNAGIFYAGQEITLTPTGQTVETLTVRSINSAANEITMTAPCALQHGAEDIVCLASPVDQFVVRVASILDHGLPFSQLPTTLYYDSGIQADASSDTIVWIGVIAIVVAAVAVAIPVVVFGEPLDPTDEASVIAQFTEAYNSNPERYQGILAMTRLIQFSADISQFVSGLGEGEYYGAP